MFITRRTALAGAAALVLATPGFANAEPVTGDVVIGAEDAPVTVIEYASFTCPHCARFHIDTWPEVKANYVDTGKVRFILREVYFDQYGLWASMTARCGGEAGFYPMVDIFLKQQSQWTKAENIGGAILQIGRRAGLSEAQLQACLSDQDYAKTLVEAYKTNATADEIQSTPTFMINGEQHSGAMGYEDFAELIDAAL